MNRMGPVRAGITLLLGGLLMLGAVTPAAAGGLEEAYGRGRLKIGVKTDFPPFGYKDQAGESHIVIAAMTMTPERGLQVNFTDPYFEVSQAALVRRNRVPEDARSYFDLVDIPSLRIGVKQATTIERFARELFPPDRIKTFPTHEEAVAALLEGAGETPRSQAQWLYQRHMSQKQEQLERRRREEQKAAGAPY